MTRLLVIDDDPHLCASLAEYFGYEGFEVEAATGCAEGIALHMKRPADIAIVDIYMPDRDGIETIVELKRCTPALKVIAMSGGGNLPKMGDYLEASLTLGANATFAKPVDPADLLAKVRELAAIPVAASVQERPARTAAADTPPFACPLCRSPDYTPVSLGRSASNPLLSLYECSGCRFTFTDPLRHVARPTGAT